VAGVGRAVQPYILDLHAFAVFSVCQREGIELPCGGAVIQVIAEVNVYRAAAETERIAVLDELGRQEGPDRMTTAAEADTSFDDQRRCALLAVYPGLGGRSGRELRPAVSQQRPNMARLQGA